MKYVVLALLWIAWCTLHSVLTSNGFIGFLKSHFGKALRFHRVAFNTIAVVTLLPLLLYSEGLKDQPFFQWEGYNRFIQFFLYAVAMFAFISGSRRYDMLHFLGLRQIKGASQSAPLIGIGQLDTGGVLAIVRHPWYTGAIALIWAWGVLDYTTLLIKCVLSLYVVIGTILEERKILLEHGEKYRAYQKRVPMFLPYNWLRGMVRKRH